MIKFLGERLGLLALVLNVSFLAPVSTLAQTPKPLPPLREQAETQQQWLKLRLERVLPS